MAFSVGLPAIRPFIGTQEQPVRLGAAAIGGLTVEYYLIALLAFVIVLGVVSCYLALYGR